MASITNTTYHLAEKLRMKKAQGYTLLELMLTVSLLAILTGLSLISIASPRLLMEAQNQKNQVAQIIAKAQLQPLLTGQATQLIFTPWALWMNERKVMELPQGGGWQWQTNIDKVRLSANGSIQLIMATGQSSASPQMAILTYNQTRMVEVEINPQLQTLGVVTHAR